VFHCLAWERTLLRRWAAYMASNAFGNLCNYWIFVTLVSLHHPVASRPAVALSLAAFTAWIVNYAAARLLVFGDAMRRRLARHAPARAPAAVRSGRRAGPSPDAPGSPRR